MPLPVILAGAYLAVNLAIMAWLVRAEARGRVPSASVRVGSTTVRYGPPLAGLVYLFTIAEDWPFVLFVAAFFLGAFWLLGGLLNYPSRRPRR